MKYELDKTCSTYGRINSHTVLFETPVVKWLFGRPRCRWEDDITICMSGLNWLSIMYSGGHL
jgi:hypothetical protein